MSVSAVRIGPLVVDPPVVLAPMAGVTDAPFRGLCAQFGAEPLGEAPRRHSAVADLVAGRAPDSPGQPAAGLYVSEMITARALVERNERTLSMLRFDESETTRSVQLYGTDPRTLGEAVRFLVAEHGVDHVDMNFGCPVPKVTRKGGGSALPVRQALLRDIIRSAVAAAGAVPVTVKFRMGVDDSILTYLRTGRIAEDEGVAAVALHARTAEQLYSGSARWDAIAALKAEVTTIPVLGNGDIWEAHDALAMLAQTGCDGVVVGRGCLGRPWLFRDLAEVFDGREPPNPPRLPEVIDVMRDHARRIVEWFGEEYGIRMFRKHAGWYTKGFRGSAQWRRIVMSTTTMAELEAAFAALDRDEPFPAGAMRVPRGKSGGTQRVSLPPGYLDDLDDATPPSAEAEDATSGG